MIKFVFRWGFRLLLLLIVLAVGLVLCKDVIVKSLIESRIRTQTGMDVRIGRFESGLFSPTITIENFKLYNTAEFGGLPCLEIPDLYVEYDRAAFVRGEIHLILVRLNIAEVTVVDTGTGKNSMDWLKSQSAPTPKKPDAELDFRGIDTLNLSLGKLKTVNLANPAKSREINLGLRNEVLKNVRSGEDLSALALKILWRNGKDLLGGGVLTPNLKLTPPTGETNAPKSTQKPPLRP